LKVDNVGAERMCSGILFQATGPATHYYISISALEGHGYNADRTVRSLCFTSSRFWTLLIIVAVIGGLLLAVYDYQWLVKVQ